MMLKRTKTIAVATKVMMTLMMRMAMMMAMMQNRTTLLLLLLFPRVAKPRRKLRWVK